MSDTHVLYLSAADVATVDLEPAVARAAVVAAFQAHHAGRPVTRPKQSLQVGPGHAFQSMCSVWEEEGLAANKWLGMANVAPGSGLPGIHALILLNDYATGQLRAIMDGNVVTALRTAAMSAAAAQFLARPDSRSIGFIGCGLQARFHLAALCALLPGLSEIHAFSRSRLSAESLVALGARQGLVGTARDDAETVIRASDVVVTSVPMSDGFTPFLDAAWIRPGAFVSSIDVGRPWQAMGVSAIDRLATDDHAQQQENAPLMPGLARPFDADLAELASGSRPGRSSPTERTMFIFRGFGLGDLAVAAKVFAAAVERSIGQYLPR
jgi:alanine dehydrogenase